MIINRADRQWSIDFVGYEEEIQVLSYEKLKEFVDTVLKSVDLRA